MTGRGFQAPRDLALGERSADSSHVEITLVPASDSDSEFLDRVYASTRQDEMDRLEWDRSAKDAFVLMQSKAQRGHYQRVYPKDRYHIVTAGGAPAGRILTAELADEIRIVDIALLPEFRGLGIGTNLITAVLRAAERIGKCCRIHVETFNPALRLYERLGFRKIEDQGVYWLLEWSPQSAENVVSDNTDNNGIGAARRPVSPEVS